jgi:hypothetical protein
MKFLSYLLFQLDEARRYIEDGRLEHLRLAFLLLDNAAEIQMDHCIKHDLQHEEMRERLRNNIFSTPSQDDLPPILQELVDWVPLSRSEKSKLDRLFDEKVDYMVGRGKHLHTGVAAPLKYLHRYRNEAYHRTEVRTETIRTASLILLEINCQMLETVPQYSRSISSAEDYSWLQERFQVKPFSIDIDLCLIADQMRSGLLANDEMVATALANHLNDRFCQLGDSLEFIVENGGLADRETALVKSQYYAEIAPPADLWQAIPSAFVPKYSLSSIQELEAQLSHIRSAPNRLGAFGRFATVEKALEPIEKSVNDLARRIDAAIQLAVDIARGK